MDPVAIGANLVASALWETADKGREWYDDDERRRAISEQIGGLSTEYNGVLKEEIDDRIDGNTLGGAQQTDLFFMLEHWDDEIAPAFASLDGYFGNEAEAVDRITETIVTETPAPVDDETEELVREIVGDGYETVIVAFESAVSEANLEAALNREWARELREQVVGNRDEIVERIEQAVVGDYDRPYELYDRPSA